MDFISAFSASSAVNMIDDSRLRTAYLTARDALLAERVPEGHWVGELSTSALSTATAAMALHLVNPIEHRALIDNGLKWLADHQNDDGGWGDTVKSFSNISTTMLCRAAFALTGAIVAHPVAVENVEAYITRTAGKTPAQRAEAIRNRYGKDRTFSVPILMASALAGEVPWHEVPRLPFELACLPQSWYRFARLPVVSYALPALIAIGQCVHQHRTSWNPIRNVMRWLARRRTLKVLQRIQPTTGGYLEATPLTSFVVMALASSGASRVSHDAGAVIAEGVRFLVNSVRPDGSWPIDTNLATWVTTLSVNALAAANDLDSLDTKDAILAWLLKQQYTERHPYTGADPGGWAWTDLAGGVPDCDDTPGSMLAGWTLHMRWRRWFGTDSPAVTEAHDPFAAGCGWVVDIQNRDGGWPTFCRGWGQLPFDRSGCDLTAHALRVLHFLRPDQFFQSRFWRTFAISDAVQAGLQYLAREQRPDGSWLPLWFGNQHAPDDINPVYGTARVLAAYRDLKMKDAPECQRGVTYLLSVQNPDGGWGGAKGCPSSVEETALAVEVLLDLVLPSPLAGEGGRRPGEGSALHPSGSADPSPPAPLPQGERGERQQPPPARGEGKAEAIERGVLWLVEAVERGRFREASPIGFYFAKLWYFEKLYPLIFTVAALGRACRGGRFSTGLTSALAG